MLRKIQSIFLKMYIRLNQKKYKKLKYLYQPDKSDTLIVSFAGFPGKGSARYNYINTLKNIDANKLFILDDFGYKKQGSYYLGENGDWFIPEMVNELINKIRMKYNINHTVMIGSSKGGTAALFYAIKLEADFCIIGAPQYHCGDYLNTENHISILEGIMGNTDITSVQKLNKVVKECICANTKYKPHIYIHYSPLEHTYQEHIVDMIHDLKTQEYFVIEDSDYNYTNHSDVAKYFPMYLLNVLNTKL